MANQGQMSCLSYQVKILIHFPRICLKSKNNFHFQAFSLQSLLQLGRIAFSLFCKLTRPVGRRRLSALLLALAAGLARPQFCIHSKSVCKTDHLEDVLYFSWGTERLTNLTFTFSKSTLLLFSISIFTAFNVLISLSPRLIVNWPPKFSERDGLIFCEKIE